MNSSACSVSWRLPSSSPMSEVQGIPFRQVPGSRSIVLLLPYSPLASLRRTVLPMLVPMSYARLGLTRAVLKTCGPLLVSPTHPLASPPPPPHTTFAARFSISPDPRPTTSPTVVYAIIPCSRLLYAPFTPVRALLFVFPFPTHCLLPPPLTCLWYQCPDLCHGPRLFRSFVPSFHERPLQH
jgi:hypothetical protein